jgi:uncharacterized membrane protein YqjE
VGTLRRIAAAASSLLLARAEFAAGELTLAGARAVRWLVSVVLASALMMLALIALSATVVLALWERLGWYSLGILTLVYAGVAYWIVIRLLREIRASPPPLVQTFAELAKDREALFGREPTSGEGPRP